MNMVQIVEQIEEIVAATIDEAQEFARGAGPEPDSEIAALKILKLLADAVKSDAVFQRELLVAMGQSAKAA